MSEWKTYMLGEICTKIGSGATPRGGKEAYFEIAEYSLIRSQNVLDFSFSTNGLAFISEQQANELKNVTIEKDDILLNITGDSVARVCQVPDEILPARVNQHVAIIRGNISKINQSFLKYYLLEPSFKGKMLSMSSSGATRNALTKVMIENFKVKVPDLATQNQIAQILTSLDDKIELNLQMNQTLEAMAQAIFKEWFVNFNFPNFDGVLENGLPKGWRMGKLGEVVSFVKGVSYRSSELIPSKFALVTLKSFNRLGGLNYRGFKEFFGKYKENQVLKEGDVIIAQTDITQAAEVIGCPAIVENPFQFEKLIASIDIVKCVPINIHFSEAVLFYFLNDKRFKD